MLKIKHYLFILIIGLGFKPSPSFSQSLGFTFSEELATDFLAETKKNSELEKLMQETLLASKDRSFRDFLNRVRFCPTNDPHGARVQQTSAHSVVFIGRDLDEPLLKNDDEIRKHYLARVQKNFSEPTKEEEMRWIILPDQVFVIAGKSERNICIKSGVPVSTSVELLAHELIHYVKSKTQAPDFDMLIYTDCLDYSQKIIEEVGNEIDAYILEYSLRIRRQNYKLFQLQQPQVALLFDESGVFKGDRKVLGQHILEKLDYTKILLEPQCKSLIKTQIKFENQRMSSNQELLKSRQTEKKSLQDFIKSRSKIFNAAWPDYKKESDRVENLLKKTEESEERLNQEIKLRKSRIDLLQMRL